MSEQMAPRLLGSAALGSKDIRRAMLPHSLALLLVSLVFDACFEIVEMVLCVRHFVSYSTFLQRLYLLIRIRQKHMGSL